MYTWLKAYNDKLCNEALAKFMVDLEKSVKIERLYGNQKDTALKKLKDFIDNCRAAHS